jgi:hypothetical protein
MCLPHQGGRKKKGNIKKGGKEDIQTDTQNPAVLPSDPLPCLAQLSASQSHALKFVTLSHSRPSVSFKLNELENVTCVYRQTDTAERAQSTVANRAEVIVYHKLNMPETLLCMRMHAVLVFIVFWNVIS